MAAACTASNTPAVMELVYLYSVLMGDLNLKKWLKDNAGKATR